jgi:hypothetical protein
MRLLKQAKTQYIDRVVTIAAFFIPARFSRISFVVYRGMCLDILSCIVELSISLCVILAPSFVFRVSHPRVHAV